jgi:Rod binding domain-containing protein
MSTITHPIATAPSAAASQSDDADKKRTQLKTSTQQFEAIFVANMLKEVRKSMSSSGGLFGNTPQARMYADMMDEAVADQMSKTGALGFGKALYKSLLKYVPGTSGADTGVGAVLDSPTRANRAGSAARTAPAGTPLTTSQSEKE